MSNIGSIIILLLQLYNFLVIARVLLSYFPNVDPYNPIVKFLFDVTEPVLAPIREILRQQFPQGGPMDFSPIVLFLIIFVLIRLVGVLF